MKLTIYTDGACNGGKNERGASNFGGWGAVFFENDCIVKMLHQPAKDTTNNREELKAIIETLKELLHMVKITDDGISATIYSDSAYCVNMINDWIFTWQTNGWSRKGNKPIENLDLVKELYDLLYNKCTKNFPTLQIEVKKTKGHSCILGNEIADALATQDFVLIERILGCNPELMGVKYKNDIYNW